MIFKKFSEKSKASNNQGDSSREDLAAAVIREISEGVVVVNQQGIITMFNPAASALTGWSTSDAVNLDYRSIFKLFDKTEHPISDQLNPILTALQLAKTAENDNCYIETSSGNHLLVALQATPLFAKQSDTPVIENLVITFRDMTDERADQNRQTEFISTASHEMRTPVAIIEGYLGMLLNPNTATVDSRGLEFAKKAHEAAQHLGRLFQDLLDVTKADDRRTLTSPILINARDAAKQITEEFKPMAQKKQLSLEFIDSENENGEAKVIQPLYIIYVDYDQLKEILGNLLENAIKYTKQGGVKVSIRENQGRIRFEITDTGIGIPAEDTTHLFQKFYRVDSSDTREIGGTGLGLYLIKKLTENMGGQVGVESEYGHGSTFWVEFANLSREEAIQKAQEMKRREVSQKQA